MTGSLVPDDFDVPATLETDRLRLRMLSVNDVVKDYDAVISSAGTLDGMFPTWRGWPKGLTLEQNLIDLGWHQKEFQLRRSFAYTVVELDESRVIGCAYIEPTQRVGYDAEVYLWARESAQGDPADKALESVVMAWVDSAWPFENVAYPGRTIDWQTWADLPLKG